MKKIVIYTLLAFFFSNCGEYEKLLKSNDKNLKYRQAISYFNKKDYQKSQRLLEYIKPLFRGTTKAQTVDYYYAFSLYNTKRYLSASLHFESFLKFHPKSSYVEECLYMQALSLFKHSPKPTLDQKPTKKAIETFQTYIDRYPKSNRIKIIHEYLDKLDNKLTYKSFLAGKGYFHRGDYKAAIISLQNTLKDFPSTTHREEISFLLLQARFKLAKNSVPNKKVDRFNAAKEEYLSFIDEFPETKYKKIADNFLKEIDKFLNPNKNI